MNNGGEKRWDVVVIYETFKIHWPLYERRYDTPLLGSIISLDQRFTIQFPQNKNRLHQFSSKVRTGILLLDMP